MKTTTITKREEEVDDENTPGAKIAVLRNELSHVNETLNRVELKIDTMATSFVTAAQMKALGDAKEIAHKELKHANNALNERLEKLEKFLDGIKTKIAGAAVVMLVLMVLAMYGLDKFFRG